MRQKRPRGAPRPFLWISFTRLSSLFVLRDFHDLINQPVLHCRLGVHVEIPVGISFDGGNVFAGVLGKYLIQTIFQPQNLARLDLDIRGLTLRASEWMMHVNGGIRQGISLSLGSGGQ